MDGYSRINKYLVCYCVNQFCIVLLVGALSLLVLLKAKDKTYVNFSDYILDLDMRTCSGRVSHNLDFDRRGRPPYSSKSYPNSLGNCSLVRYLMVSADGARWWGVSLSQA